MFLEYVSTISERFDMCIFDTAYDTTVGSSLNMSKTISAIKQAFVQDILYSSNLDLISSLKYVPVFVSGRGTSESNIPLFAHPIVFEHSGHSYIVSDIRPVVKVNSDSEYGFDIRNKIDFDFIKYRLIMNLIWLNDGAMSLKNDLGLAGVVFAAWMSDSIGRRFGLDPRDQLLLMIVSHYYYQSLFYNEINEDIKQTFAVHTIKATRAPSELVLDIFDRIGEMGSIADYCNNVKAVVENIRLKDLNAGLVITLMGNSWFGLNSKEVLAVAIEHPPTWVSLVYTVLKEKTYRNSQLARVAERYTKKSLASDYNQAFENMVENLIKPPMHTGFKPFD
jgi:hypothetical protein